MKFKLNEQFDQENIFDYLKNYYGVVEKPYYGPTYILPDGSMLNIAKCKHHAEVEKTLIDAGFSTNEYIPTGGSPTMRDLGAIRCDTVKYYIEIPCTQLTRKQYNTLLIWLDFLATQCRLVDVIADVGRVITTYNFKESISDDIVDRIRRYYACGKLYEETDAINHIRQYDAKYLRKPITEELSEFDDNSVNEEFKLNPRFVK